MLRMDDLEWPRALNKVITQRWSQLKNSLVMKDFVDYLIQKRVVTLDYWMSLKSKPISESERTEDFLALVMKFDRQKYNYFMEALLTIHREDLVKSLIKVDKVKSKKPTDTESEGKHQFPKKVTETIERSKKVKEADHDKYYKGQTDADQLPSAASKERGAEKSRSIEAITEKSGKNEPSSSKQTKISEKLHQGIGNGAQGMGNGDKGNGNGDKGNGNKGLGDSRKQNKTDPVDSDKEADSSTNTKKKKNVEFKKTENTMENDPQKTNEDEAKNARPGTSKSREEILEERENLLNSRESELSRKERELKEHEISLQEKETELLTRENSFLTNRSVVNEMVPLSLPAKLQHLKMADSNSPTASTTESSELLADVREQLKAMKKVKEEIESEHPSFCPTPKEEFARLQDFQNVQQNIDELKEEIATDRESRENVQKKVEYLKHEIEILQSTIKNMEEEKETKNIDVDREINRLKTELKRSQSNYNEGINRIKMEMKSKEEKIKEFKESLEKDKQYYEDLEKRIKVLENDKRKYEIDLERYEEEVADLKRNLEEKENKLADLRTVLEQTENEKEELIDELAELKNEVSKLKADKKRLESEKKTLLGRCVKPQWNQGPPGTGRRNMFK